MMSTGNRLNLMIGVAMTGLVSCLVIGLLLNEYRRPVFAAHNAWFWFALMGLMLSGFVVAIAGLLRRIGCGYFIWSQLVLSVFVAGAYIGWYRRELDYVKMGPDPDALDRSPPSVSVSGFMILLLMWLVIGFLPLAIRQFRRWIVARKDASAAAGDEIRSSGDGR